MIPVWVVIKIDSAQQRRFRLRLPLLLVWALLLAFALVLASLMALLCLLRGINPIRVSCVVLHALASASGTRVEVQNPQASFLMHIV